MKESLAKNFTSRLGPLADARAVWVMSARSRVSTKQKYSPPRPCRRQEGGLSRAVTHPPLPQARGRLVLPGHGPARPARPRAGSSCPATGRLVLPGHGPARPARPRAGLSCPATGRLVLPGHGPACPARSRAGLSCPATGRLVLPGHGPKKHRPGGRCFFV